MAHPSLPPHYHRDWQRKKREANPEWYEDQKRIRGDRRRAAKEAAIASYGGKCGSCGGVFPPCVFEFHHRDPREKDRTPAQLFMLSQESINKELAKCDMLCANCHRIVHHESGEYGRNTRKNANAR